MPSETQGPKSKHPEEPYSQILADEQGGPKEREKAEKEAHEVILDMEKRSDRAKNIIDKGIDLSPIPEEEDTTETIKEKDEGKLAKIRKALMGGAISKDTDVEQIRERGKKVEADLARTHANHRENLKSRAERSLKDRRRHIDIPDDVGPEES